MTLLPRRRLFGIGAALLAAPAIVRVSSIMPVSVLPEEWYVTYQGARVALPSGAYDVTFRVRCVWSSGPGAYAVGDTFAAAR